MPGRLMVVQGGLWVPAVPDTAGTVNPDDRSQLGPGSYIPSAATTGVPAGTTLTNYNAPGTAGTVAIPPGDYYRKHFYGDCYPASPTGGYTFTECYFHGGIGHPGNNQGCFYCWSLTTGWATFVDCTVAADSPSYYRDGIVGHRYTVRRCNIHTVNDAVGGNANGGGIIEANWLHDLVWWRQDPAHSDGTHNDPIQIQGGGPWTIVGNLCECYTHNAAGSTEPNPQVSAVTGLGYGSNAIIVNQQNALNVVTGTVIANNVMRGGNTQINLNNNKGAGYTLAVTLGPNTFARDVRDNYPPNPDKRWMCLYPNGGTIDAAGLYTNLRFEDTGALLLPGRASGIRTM